jgi:hypothetical protein
MVANVLFVTGTMVILLEGLICAILIIPLFALLGSVGGLIMGLVCRKTRWPKQAACSFVLMPVLLGTIPGSQRHDERIAVIERAAIVDAPPAVIWNEIHNARDIKPQEVERGWMYRIGVPLPIAGVTEITASGRERKITMGKGVHFAQVVTDWKENSYVRWTYRFSDDSFPPGALDDHVRIGGRYFDLIDTSYTLIPINERTTQLTVRISYRISTQFNWYTDPIARLLIGNFEEVILDFYGNRSALSRLPT